MPDIIKTYTSPNCYNGRKGAKPDVIVNHITGGAYTSAINTFMNPACEVSSHFIVTKFGHIYQMVDLQNGAWCNGTSTDGGKRDYRKATSALVRGRPMNANLYSISIEHENSGGGFLTDAQFAASVELHKHIIAEVKRLYGIDIPVNREHIIGHYQIHPSSRPGCPGKNFPWEKLMASLNPLPYFEYTIKPGDTFWGMAQKQMGSGGFNKKLAEYNGLTPTSIIYPGQVIKIPK